MLVGEGLKAKKRSNPSRPTAVEQPTAPMAGPNNQSNKGWNLERVNDNIYTLKRAHVAAFDANSGMDGMEEMDGPGGMVGVGKPMLDEGEPHPLDAVGN